MRRFIILLQTLVLLLLFVSVTACNRTPHMVPDVHKPAAPAPLLGQDTNIHPPTAPDNRERYGRIEDNPVRLTREHPVSTFSIDVDTGAYANVRRMLQRGGLPPHDAVRAEEFINYFDYGYPAPTVSEQPFAVITEIAPAPWHPQRHLLHIGLQGYEVPAAELPPANLVFLLDVSGSMHSPDKLPLLQAALRLLTRQLRPQDRVAIAVYAGASGVVLESTPGDQQDRILAAIDRLRAGGSTHGSAGIQLAYELARQGFRPKGINRVLLATDGDFNVGTVNFYALRELIEQQRASGIALTTLGFGTGNYNEYLLEQLADSGNGNYAYIDTLKEAHKVLNKQLAGTLYTIAKDVKVQVEFNPEQVTEYRLIGYENRLLRREDFNNDRVDAGEIGAGHAVTALYEVVLRHQPGRIDPLRYGPAPTHPGEARQNELAHLKLRYKLPDESASRKVTHAIHRSALLSDAAAASEAFRFAAAVAAFAQKLRGGSQLGDFAYNDIAELARAAQGRDRDGYRAEFLTLVELARALQPHHRAARDEP